ELFSKRLPVWVVDNICPDWRIKNVAGTCRSTAEAFMPSILRRYPLISLTADMATFMPPIAELILMRISSGLYYDIIPGKQPLLNEANDRFEQYCHDLIDELTVFVTSRSHRDGQALCWRGLRATACHFVVRGFARCGATRVSSARRAIFAKSPRNLAIRPLQ